MRLEFIELIDSLVHPEGTPFPSAPHVLVITKAGKYLKGHITDHNVRVLSDGKVRGRIVMSLDGQKKEVDANDITSLEKIKN
jgi:hypothetical protein